MQSILDAINEWIKGILIGAINGNLSTMFGDVNEKVGTIANEVGKTPQGWNANIFSMIQNLSENVIVPIAGLVITYVLCVELISMVTEKNNLHDVDTFMFFKWFFKAFVAVFLVTHTFDITMAVFDMAQHIVSGAAGVISSDTAIDAAEALASMQEGLEEMEIPELLLLMLETSLVSLCMKIMSVLITVILYGRMIEICYSLTLTAKRADENLLMICEKNQKNEEERGNREMESQRDILRVIEKEIKKGSAPVAFAGLGFSEECYHLVDSQAKMNQLLDYFFRNEEYAALAERQVKSNIYAEMGKRLNFRSARSDRDRKNMEVAAKRWIKKKHPRAVFPGRVPFTNCTPLKSSDAEVSGEPPPKISGLLPLVSM